jgi:hypothetical protein
MAKYKQKGFNAGEGTGSSKKIDHAKRYPDHGEGDKVHTYSDVFSMKSPTGPYSTIEGDLMSGRDAGLGEFGQTDTKIGGLGRGGKQRVSRGFRQTDVASSLDETMANKPRASRISADMSAVDVVEKKGPSRKELRQQKRAQRQAEREAKRAERKKKRLAAREARRARRA